MELTLTYPLSQSANQQIQKKSNQQTKFTITFTNEDDKKEPRTIKLNEDGTVITIKTNDKQEICVTII